MKKILLNIIAIMSLAACSLDVFSQEEFEYDTTAMTPAKCLSDSHHFISVNMLQFATGTVNLNYEYKIVPQFSIKVGAGTVLGSRILFNEAQQPCIAGGFYGLVEPRFYFKKASESCLIQYGLSASYKYWNFTAKNHILSKKEFEKEFMSQNTSLKGQDLLDAMNEAKKNKWDSYKNDDTYSVTDEDIYEKCDEIEQLGTISFFGKGCIAGGLTAEVEVGVGLGVLDKDFYFTPNLGLSFGWTF